MGLPALERAVKDKIAPPQAAGDQAKNIRLWISQLDNGNFAVREKATAELKKHLAAAIPLLDAELAGSPSLEARRRIDTLLSARPAPDRDSLRRQIAQRLLTYLAERDKN